MNEPIIARVNKMALDAPVAVTLPAFVWVQFWTEYGAADWSSLSTSLVAIEAQKMILDPIYINECKAAMQEHEDKMQHVHQMGPFGIVIAQPGEPGATDPRDDPL